MHKMIKYGLWLEEQSWGFVFRTTKAEFSPNWGPLYLPVIGAPSLWSAEYSDLCSA